MTAMTKPIDYFRPSQMISIHTPMTAMTAILPKNHSLFLFKPNKPAPSIFRFVPSSPSLTLFFSLYLCTFPVRIPQAKTTCFRFAPFIFCNTLSFLPAILPSTALDTGTSSTPSQTPGKPSFLSPQAERSSLPHRNLFPVQTTLQQYYLLLLLP